MASAARSRAGRAARVAATAASWDSIKASRISSGFHRSRPEYRALARSVSMLRAPMLHADHNIPDPKSFLRVDLGATKTDQCAPNRYSSGLTAAEPDAAPGCVRPRGPGWARPPPAPPTFAWELGVCLPAFLEATKACLEQAGLSSRDLPRIIACLALAGASEPTDLAAAQRLKLPLGRAVITSDAPAARVG